MISANEFDFATVIFKPQQKQTTIEILTLFDKQMEEATSILKTADDETMNGICTLRRGEQIMFQLPRKVILRSFALNHVYHHRGQMSVFLRFLNVPVPGMYGPSADDKKMMTI